MPAMKPESTAAIKPQRRERRREGKRTRTSAFFAVQKGRIAHFEQDFLSCCFLRAHRVSAVQGALAFWLRLRCSKDKRSSGLTLATFLLSTILAAGGSTNSWRVFRSLSSGVTTGPHTVVHQIRRGSGR